MYLRSRVLVASAALGALYAACVSACSSTSSLPISCGPGTHLVDGSCVPAAADSGGPPEDGGENDAESNPDATSSDSATADGSGGTDGPDAAPMTADPCPTSAITVDCDPACQPAGSGFCRDTCESNNQGYSDPQIETLTLPATLRTPGMPPGWDAAPYNACQTACESSGSTSYEPIVYGIAFRVAQPPLGEVVEVRAGAPWWIDTIDYSGAPLFCPYDPPMDTRAQGCNSWQTGAGDEVFLVWTDDPSAVARNITVSAVSMTAACQ